MSSRVSPPTQAVYVESEVEFLPALFTLPKKVIVTVTMQSILNAIIPQVHEWFGSNPSQDINCEIRFNKKLDMFITFKDEGNA